MSATSPERETGFAGAKEYEQYRSLFFSALAGLARRGFRVSPDDSLDLIHDFFVEAWPGLIERHDPQKAKLSTYAFGAFVRFARPRIIRLQRWRRQLDDTAGDEAQAEGADIELEIDATKVERARASLSSEDRAILDAHYALGRSERELAASLSTSRYKARERLAQALSRLVHSLQDPALSASVDWAIAVLLWRDAKSITDVARELNLTENQVRSRKRKLIYALTHAVPSSVAAQRGNHVSLEGRM